MYNFFFFSPTTTVATILCPLAPSHISRAQSLPAPSHFFVPPYFHSSTGTLFPFFFFTITSHLSWTGSFLQYIYIYMCVNVHTFIYIFFSVFFILSRVRWWLSKRRKKKNFFFLLYYFILFFFFPIWNCYSFHLSTHIYTGQMTPNTWYICVI